MVSNVPPFDERPPALPAALERVSPPRYLSPSRFAALLRCPLSVVHGLQGAELLPPHPTAVLGTLVHAVMQAVRGREPVHEENPQDTVDETFEHLLREIESNLSSNPSTSRLVPLDRAVGRTRWLQRKARLRAWAASLLTSRRRRTGSHGGQTRHRTKPRRDHDVPSASKVPIGSEQPMKVPELRLSGRPDILDRDPDGTVHVTDLKTGPVSDEDGLPLGDYALQVRLYGLMVERIAPNSRVRLWLEGSDRVEVPWDQAIRNETEESLRAILDRLPHDRSLAADSLAREGPQCKWCRVRHRCPRYRRVAPVWWTEVSTSEPIAPFDTWGTLLGVEARNERSYEATVRDAAGRLVRISGLEASLGIGNLHDGDGVWFFELESSERLPHHGAYVHPRNFHGARPGRGWSDALRLQVFGEPSYSAPPVASSSWNVGVTMGGDELSDIADPSSRRRTRHRATSDLDEQWRARRE